MCVDIFQERGHQADVKNKISPEQLHGIVGDYDGMVIRSATKVRGRIENSLVITLFHFIPPPEITPYEWNSYSA